MNIYRRLYEYSISPDSNTVTQGPWHADRNNRFRLFITHIIIGSATNYIQQYYDTGSSQYSFFADVPIYMMTTSNAIVGVFGSIRWFDFLTCAELALALVVCIYYRWWLFIPIIFIMCHQALRRLGIAITIRVETRRTGAEPRAENTDPEQ
ncbi:unnamed protein product [Caenorhabditis brenneri]